MILFRQRYPRWWFDFAREFTRFGARVGAYVALLGDQYPFTTDEQSVHLEIDYPDLEKDLNRWLPLVKWFLAIPRCVVLAVLGVIAVFAIIIAWFAILITGRYPRALFDYVSTRHKGDGGPVGPPSPSGGGFRLTGQSETYFAAYRLPSRLPK
jgi:hypothetical protein